MFGGAELPLLWAAVFLAALAETALRFVSLSKLEEELKSPGAKGRYSRYLEHERAASAFCVLARVVCSVAFVALVIQQAIQDSARLLPAALAAAALLVLAQLAARAIGRKWSTGILLVLLPPVSWLSYPLRPLRVTGRRPAVGDNEEPEPEVVDAAKEEIRVALEDGAAEGALEAEEMQMIEGILKFRDVDVAEIMTPRPDIECLEAGMPVRQAVKELQSLHHSRIPVYEDMLDQVIGIVYVKDLLAALTREDNDGITLRDVMREPLFVPETKTVGPLLQQFQNQHVQIAVVLDEYGGVNGVVTVEDIMEEIVGEIEDEYDEEDHENRILRRSSGAIEVDARVHIGELNDLLDLNILEDEDYDTVGGYVMDHFARVPEPGEEFRANGVLIHILQSDKRRVRRVLIKR